MIFISICFSFPPIQFSGMSALRQWAFLSTIVSMIHKIIIVTIIVWAINVILLISLPMDWSQWDHVLNWPCVHCLPNASFSLWILFSIACFGAKRYEISFMIRSRSTFVQIVTAITTKLLHFSWSRSFRGIAGRITPVCNNCGRLGHDRCLIDTFDQALYLSRMTWAWPRRPGGR